MKLDWMENYRDLTAAMIGMGNAYMQIYNNKCFIPSLQMSPAQLQVMEYILENEERNENMSAVAARLSISQSSFSKISNQLVKRGFLEKYHAENNKKNVILRVSDYGRKCYYDYCHSDRIDIWKSIYKKMDTLDKESVQVFVDCMNEFTGDIMHTLEKQNEAQAEPKLIKIES